MTDLSDGNISGTIRLDKGPEDAAESDDLLKIEVEEHHHDLHGPGLCTCCHHDEEGHSVLGWAFAKMGAKEDGFLNRHRKGVTLGVASLLAAFEYATLGATTNISHSAIVGVTALLAHDASEDLMDSINALKHSHKLNGSAIGMAVGAAHTSSELMMSAFATGSSYQNLALATTMGSNVSHILLTVGAAATVGAVTINKNSAYAVDIAAILGTTAAFGYQIATGEFNPYLSSAMIVGSLGHIYWRLKAGDTRIKIDADGSPLNDLPSVAEIKTSVKAIPSKAMTRLNQSVNSLKDKVSSLSIPSLRQAYSSVRGVIKSATHSNIAALMGSLTAVGLSTHILGNNLVKMVAPDSYTTTAMGATFAAVAFVLPELWITAKAAVRNHGDVAWGAITGCTVATVGIVGAYQGLSGFEVPKSLSLAFNEGQLLMGAFVGSAFALAAAVHPKVNRKLAKLDNVVADFFENKIKPVSNWLRNDGTKISKLSAGSMLASAALFYGGATNTIPLCHSHGTYVDCIVPAPENLPPPTAEDAMDTLQRAVPQTADELDF